MRVGAFLTYLGRLKGVNEARAAGARPPRPRARRPRRLRAQALRRALEGHAAESAVSGGDHPRARPADSRRALQRTRPGQLAKPAHAHPRRAPARRDDPVLDARDAARRGAVRSRRDDAPREKSARRSAVASSGASTIRAPSGSSRSIATPISRRSARFRRSNASAAPTAAARFCSSKAPIRRRRFRAWPPPSRRRASKSPGRGSKTSSSASSPADRRHRKPNSSSGRTSRPPMRRRWPYEEDLPRRGSRIHGDRQHARVHPRPAGDAGDHRARGDCVSARHDAKRPDPGRDCRHRSDRQGRVRAADGARRRPNHGAPRGAGASGPHSGAREHAPGRGWAGRRRRPGGSRAVLASSRSARFRTSGWSSGRPTADPQQEKAWLTDDQASPRHLALVVVHPNAVIANGWRLRQLRSLRAAEARRPGRKRNLPGPPRGDHQRARQGAVARSRGDRGDDPRQPRGVGHGHAKPTSGEPSPGSTCSCRPRLPCCCSSG